MSGVPRIHSAFQALARRLSTPEFIEFDSWAIWFYAACVFVFVVASAADLNGSSMHVFRRILQRGAVSPPIAGFARAVRVDEWGVHTPAILNQAFRGDKFAVQTTVIGTHSIALLANVPVAHLSTLFRPQFWGFFFLPAGYAFAVYWQCKALFLLTGLFTWLLLLTRSTLWSVAGALWFFFSAYVQWTYSWPSLLPEMIGLLCFVMACACYLTIGANRSALWIASIGGAACAINFGMCGYPPHLIPLVWLAVFFFAAWCIAKRRLIFRKEQASIRILCAAGAILLIAAISLLVYVDARGAIHAMAKTVYPGHRRFPSQMMVPEFYTLNFLDWGLTENRLPLHMPNICETVGFLWIAPATLFCLSRMAASKFQKLAFAALWCFFALMLTWMLAPVPLGLGKLLLLTRTGGTRPTLALGLANVALVAICIASMTREGAANFVPEKPLASLARAFGVFIAVSLVLFLTNESLIRFLPIREVMLIAVFTTVLLVLLLEGRKKLLAAALVIPSALVFGGVNPIERGVKVFESSSLYRFLHQNRDYLNSQWMVFTPAGDLHSAEFFIGVGGQVYNGLHYLPDVDHFDLFREFGYNAQLLNSAANLIVKPIPAGTQPSLQNGDFGILVWNVSPSDPILKQLGIRYVAFSEKPSPAVLPGLIPLNTTPLDNFWLYRLP